MSQSRPTDARIKELAEKKAQLDAQIAALDARRRLSQKKNEDRIKWLLGTLVFDNLSAEPALQSPELVELVRRDLPDRLKWLLGTLVFDRLSAEPALQSIVRRDLPERLTQRDRDRGLLQILFPDSDEDRS